MTELELKDNDVFHVIGFKYPDVLSGAPVQLMRRLGMPAPSGTKLVEVYFLDSSLPDDPPTFKPHEDDVSFYFYSDTARALSKEYGIKLPPVVATCARSKLPGGLSTSIKMLVR
jgi:hypothetical protein